MKSQFFFSIAILLLGLGIVLLTAALFQIKEIIRRLPRGSLRRRWLLLLGFTILFLISYIVFLLAFWNQFTSWVNLIVPGVFFFGACFVWLISSLSLQTAIDIRRIYRLEEESVTDLLTGVYNRRYLERRLGEEFSHARQFDSPLSLLMIDVDHFKEINDTAGHYVGDQVIAQLAKLMQTTIRGSDVLVRYGGDEFIIVALNTSNEAAAAFAKKIVKHVNFHSLRVNNENNATIEIKVTISIGVAGLSDEITEINQIIRNADKALYCAKKEGRNRATVYPHNCD
jgi:diguanylate cyclase (GGDEF)-like protein